MFGNSAGNKTRDCVLFESSLNGTAVGGFNRGRMFVAQSSNRSYCRLEAQGEEAQFIPPLDVWSHIIITISSTNIVNTYVDGVNQTVNKFINNIMTYSNYFSILRLGANIGDRNNQASFDGSLDEFKIWNRVLTANEILTVA